MSKLPIIIIAVVLIIAGIVIFWGKKGPTDSGPKNGNGLPKEISIENAVTLGVPDAEVTIVEFSDFQCPACGYFANNVFPQFKNDFIDTGRVKFAFKHFPLPNHNFAKKAAEASECANDQGKFWEYGEILFKNQTFLSLEDLKKYAKGLALDEQKFNACLDSGKFSDKVAGDLSQAQKAKLRGTPTFFIKGQEIFGVISITDIQAILAKNKK